MDVEDTIVAIASPASPAVRGIVRLSGTEVTAILTRLGVDTQASNARPRRFPSVIDVGPPLGEVSLDVMLWPTRRSYTGQPSAELHTFGSLPILQALVDATLGVGARAARPGEFTMRAFLAGRLDLTQAEAVLGVIEAETRGSLDHALRQLSGNLSRPLERMRSVLLDLLADVEAGLDFVDEDIEFISDEVLVERMVEMSAELDSIASDLRTRSGGVSRTVITLRGRPNAGKSHLLNALAGHNAAIVADVAGTTRDAVHAEAEIGGHPVQLIDTAGIEETDCEVGMLSQQQGDRASSDADIRLWCLDSSLNDLVAAREEVRSGQAINPRHAIDLCIATKTDLGCWSNENGWIGTSAETGAGIDALRSAIVSAIVARDRQESGSVLGTAARCVQSLTRAREAIRAAMVITSTSQGHEFVAAELRTAVDALGEVTGAVYTDDILDRVFSRFCIGK
jgi:tRNA modification GTPase